MGTTRTRLTAVPELIPREVLGPDRWWARWGACVGLDPDLFYAERGKRDITAEARTTCADCSVLVECRSYGVWYEGMGIWGGTSPKDREWIRRQLNYRLPPKSKEIALPTVTIS